MNKRILVIFGTRPEAIKMIPVIKAIQRKDFFDLTICVTGQHKEMLEQVLKAFAITPDYDLNIMKKNQDLFDITIETLSKLKQVFLEAKPDLILVHGDTTTTFVSALAAFYLNIPIAHVEAGLRTYDIKSPFPEEFNRKVVDTVSELYFVPTKNSRINLIKEGINSGKIFITGNTAIDTLKMTVDRKYNHEVLKWVGDSKLVLLTAHRRENLGKPLINIFKAVKLLLQKYKNIKVIYPIHMNPQIRLIASEELGNVENIMIINPLDVIDFHNLMARSFLILTDSGGIQEEAPSFGVPVLVLRNSTERPEGIKAGTLKLIGTDVDSIVNNVSYLIENKRIYHHMSKAINPYGDGNAAQKILQILISYFGLNNDVK